MVYLDNFLLLHVATLCSAKWKLSLLEANKNNNNNKKQLNMLSGVIDMVIAHQGAR